MKVVELRVHGVSGTPPEEMLEAHHVRQIAGDLRSRFFEPVDSLGNPITRHRQRADGESGELDDIVLEGYHWGEFTSGSWTQGLWLVLIPFGFVNASQFMLPEALNTPQKFTHSLAGAGLRVLGLVLTCTFALATALITIDLLAYQTIIQDDLGPNFPPGVWLVLGEAAALLVMYGLFRLGRGPATSKPADTAGSDVVLEAKQKSGTQLDSDRFYAGSPNAPTLAWLHLGAGVVTIALVALLVNAQAASDISGFEDGLLMVGWVTLALITLLVLVIGDPDESAQGDWTEGKLSRMRADWHNLMKARQVGAFAAGFAGILALLSAPPLISGVEEMSLRSAQNQVQPLSASETVANILIIGGTIALGILFTVCAVLAVQTRPANKVTPRPFRRFARGMGAPILATTGLFLGIGYASAAALATAEVAGAKDTPDALRRVVFTWGCTVVLFAAVGIGVWLSSWRSLHSREKRARAAYARSTPPNRVDEAWYMGLAKAVCTARLKNRLSGAVILFVFMGAMLSLWMTLGIIRHSQGLFPWLSEGLTNGLVNLGIWVLVGAAGMLIALGRKAIKAHEKRRAVNVVWDVMSFWPRSTHPFVPPPYSKLAVPALRDRIQYHLGLNTKTPDRHTGFVLLAAHSQGTLIAFAALLLLPQEARDRIGLLTYGSQLQLAFARAFPAYVNLDRIRQVDDALSRRWINLYRDTDHIAGPVLSWQRTPDTNHDEDLKSRRLEDWLPERSDSGENPAQERDKVVARTGRRECGRDWRLLDPSPADKDLQMGYLTAILKHSHYPRSADWADAVERLLCEQHLALLASEMELRPPRRRVP